MNWIMGEGRREEAAKEGKRREESTDDSLARWRFVTSTSPQVVVVVVDAQRLPVRCSCAIILVPPFHSDFDIISIITYLLCFLTPTLTPPRSVVARTRSTT